MSNSLKDTNLKIDPLSQARMATIINFANSHKVLNRTKIMQKFMMKAHTLDFFIENIKIFAEKTNQTELYEKFNELELSGKEPDIDEETKKILTNISSCCFDVSNSPEKKEDKDVVDFICNEDTEDINEIANLEKEEDINAFLDKTIQPNLEEETLAPVEIEIEQENITPTMTKEEVPAKEILVAIEEETIKDEKKEEENSEKDVLVNQEKIEPKEEPLVVVKRENNDTPKEYATLNKNQKSTDEVKNIIQQKHEANTTLKQNSDLKQEDKKIAVKKNKSNKEESPKKKRKVLKIIAISFSFLFLLSVIVVGGMIYLKKQDGGVGSLNMDTIIPLSEPKKPDLFAKAKKPMNSSSVENKDARDKAFADNKQHFEKAQKLKRQKELELKTRMEEALKKRNELMLNNTIPADTIQAKESEKIIQEEIRFNDIRELANIKDSVILDDDTFIYEGVTYGEGDDFYGFSVVKITKSFIKFKNEDNKKTKVRL